MLACLGGPRQVDSIVGAELWPALRRVRIKYPARQCALELVFRPAGAHRLPISTHGLRRGLYSYAAPRLKTLLSSWRRPVRR